MSAFGTKRTFAPYDFCCATCDPNPHFACRKSLLSHECRSLPFWAGAPRPTMLLLEAKRMLIEHSAESVSEPCETLPRFSATVERYSLSIGPVSLKEKARSLRYHERTFSTVPNCDPTFPRF